MKITMRELQSLVKSGFTPKISTPTGLEGITDVYQKTGVGSNIKFSDGTTLKAAEYHQVFKGNDWTIVKNLQVGDSFSSKEITEIHPVQIQDWLDFSVDADHQSYFHEGILHHNSGKSMVLYAKMRFHIDKFDHKIILVVPSTQLVEQMFSDFKEYSSLNGWEVDANVQTLYSGKDKVFNKQVMISTWQSLLAMKKNHPIMFKDITQKTDVLLMDEAHQYKSSVVCETINDFVNTEFRTGTTGTLDESKINKLVLIGLMGNPFQVTTTKKLMDAGQVTELKIKAIILDHPAHLKKELKGMTYEDEIRYLVTSEPRNKFIANLAKACSGNTLILFNFVEIHGKVIFDLIKSIVPEERTVRLITGEVSVKEREEVRRLVDTEKNAIIVATSSLFSTGTNIPSIENIIFAVPTKSTIRVRQSIGRGLRLKNGKTGCTLFDISDDISYKSFTNTTLRHLEERLKIYDKEEFEYKLMKLPLK